MVNSRLWILWNGSMSSPFFLVKSYQQQFKINWLLISPFKLPWNKTKKREKRFIVNCMVFFLGWHERWRWRIKAFNRHLIAGRRLVSNSPTETRTLLAITDLLTIALYGRSSIAEIEVSEGLMVLFSRSFLCPNLGSKFSELPWVG